MILDEDRLGRSPVFAALSASARKRLASTAATCTLAAEECGFIQGQIAGDIMFLMEGRLKLVRMGRSGRSAILRIAHPGELFCMAPLIGATHHDCSSVAVVEAEIARWPAEQWFGLLHRTPAMAAQLLRIVGDRLDEAQERIVDLSTLRVSERLTREILRIADEVGLQEEGGTRIDLPLTRQDLAAMAGTTLHHVSRILQRWERRGLITGGRRTITIRDLPDLVRLAAGRSHPSRERGGEG